MVVSGQSSAPAEAGRTSGRSIVPPWLSALIGSTRVLRLSRELAWVILGNCIALIGSIAAVRVLTELLSPQEYGEMALALTVATLGHQVALGPTSNAVARFYAPAAEAGSLSSYAAAARRLMLTSTGATLLLHLAVVIALLALDLSTWLALAITTFAFSIFVGWNAAVSGLQNAARKRIVVALHQGAEPWVRLALAALFILWLGPSSEVCMAAFALGALLVLASQLAFARSTLPHRDAPSDDAASWLTKLRAYSWPFVAWGVFAWCQQSSDRWALEAYVSTHELGLYAALFQIGYYPLSVATSFAMQFIGPILYARAGDASDPLRNARVRKISWTLIGVNLAGTALLFGAALAWHEQIFAVVAAPGYAAISYLLPWVLLAGGIFAAGQIVALKLMSQLKTGAMAAVKVTTAAGGVALNFAGAYFYGVDGVVAAGLIFSIAYFVWMAAISPPHKPQSVR